MTWLKKRKKNTERIDFFFPMSWNNLHATDSHDDVKLVSLETFFQTKSGEEVAEEDIRATHTGLQQLTRLFGIFIWPRLLDGTDKPPARHHW